MFIADLHNIHVYCGDTTYLRSLYTPCYLPHSLQTLCQPTVSATCIALHVTRFGLSTDPDSHRKPVHPASVLIANCLMSQQLDSVSPLTPVSHMFRLVLRPVVPSKRGAVHPVFVGSTCERTGPLRCRLYVRGRGEDTEGHEGQVAQPAECSQEALSKHDRRPVRAHQGHDLCPHGHGPHATALDSRWGQEWAPRVVGNPPSPTWGQGSFLVLGF